MRSRYDIPLFQVDMNPMIADTLLPVLHSGYITQGPQVDQFERELGEYLGIPDTSELQPLTVNSATAGLTIAYRLCADAIRSTMPQSNRRPIQVASCPKTCLATHMPLCTLDLAIHWIDIDPETFMMDLNKLEEALHGPEGATIRIIIAVHWGGILIDLDRLEQIRQRAQETYGHPIYVVEDCAHAFGARIHGMPLGICPPNTFRVFSFQAIKHLTTGDGGMILVPNATLYHRAKRLRWYGIDRDAPMRGIDARLEADVCDWGYKAHMNDISATIGLANLPRVESRIANARRLAKRYDTLFHSFGIQTQQVLEGIDPAYWLYSIRVPDGPALIETLTRQGIQASGVHKRNDVHSCFAAYIRPLPMLDAIDANIVCLPILGVSPSQGDRVVYTTLANLQTLTPPPSISFQELDASTWHDYCFLKNHDSHVPFPEARYEQMQSMGTHIWMMYQIPSNGTESRICIGSGKLCLENALLGDPFYHLEDIQITPMYQRRGWGTRLVQFLRDQCKQHPIYKIVLSCTDVLVPFYSQCGFKREGVQMTHRIGIHPNDTEDIVSSDP